MNFLRAVLCAAACLLSLAPVILGEVNSIANEPGGVLWSNSRSWSLQRLPTSSDDVFIDNSTVLLQSGEAFAGTLNVFGGGHLLVHNSKISVSAGFNVSELSLVSMTGNTSQIVANTMHIRSGVLTGSGSINATQLICDRLCEIDVLTWSSRFDAYVNKTGLINIHGDVIFDSIAQPPLRDTPAFFNRSILTLGAFRDANKVDHFSQFSVSGKLYLGNMLISVLFSPNSSVFASSLPESSISSAGGIVLNSGSRNLSFQFVNATENNYFKPPFPNGIHVGRYVPPRTSGSLPLGPPPNGGSPAPSCGQFSSTNLVIIFGSTTCPTCVDGYIYSTSTRSCIPNCPDPTCSGRGTCGEDNGVARCLCSFGWTGTSCQLPDCPKVGDFTCNLRGHCQAPVSAGEPALCSCNSGYVPPFCLPEVTVLTPTASNSTSPLTPSGEYICGGTTCARGADGCTALSECRCLANFTGTRCETPQCPNSCSGNGQCDGSRLPPACSCSANWIGDDCSARVASADSTDAIAGLPRVAFIGIISASAFVVLAAIVAIIIFTFNSRAKAAARPFASRAVATQETL